MSQLAIQGIVLLLMLAALPLTSFGTDGDATWATIAGLVAIGVAGLVPPILRYAGPGDDEGDDET